MDEDDGIDKDDSNNDDGDGDDDDVQTARKPLLHIGLHCSGAGNLP